MPKKKLTKAQVKRALKAVFNNMDRLMIDKLLYRTDSNVPMSLDKIKLSGDNAFRALKRVK
tara:strand:+ start:524 stop:706 length:183 start_codon:yes stop_codon:yes gene_type:complete